MGFVMKGGRLHRLGQPRTGLAFAVYCAGCCGALLIPLYLFAAASGSLLLGTVASAGFPLAMAVPVAILGLMGRRWTSLSERWRRVIWTGPHRTHRAHG